MFLISKDKSECCGCTACKAVCSVNAISMQADNEGFYYPVKDTGKCTDCGVCEKVCSFVDPVYNNNTLKVFATYVKDKTERQRSTSGALFYALAKAAISSGGVVYGAEMDRKLTVFHRGARSIGQLQAFRGSKYVQSNLKECFNEIKRHLKEKRLVYFTGTPCQVAGLKGYLRRDYSNLLTSDIICHGVPSQQLFNQHIAFLKKKHKTNHIYNYRFRDYKKGSGCESFNYTSHYGNERISYSPTYEISPFLYSFMYAFTYRYACYKCPFAKLPRQGDITLADFWGVKQFYPEIDNSNGVSLVLVNSEQGMMYWDKIKDELFYQESDVEKAALQNKNLVRPTEMPTIRKGIYEKIEKEGYAAIASTLFRAPNYRKLKIKLFLRKLLGDKLTHIYHIVIGKK